LSVSSRVLSSNLTSRSSFGQHDLARQPQSAGSSHGLLFPTAHEGSKVHLPRVQPARYVPPSGFGYPLDGLLPSVPCRFFFTPAALMGFTLRSVPLSKGIRRISVRMIPPTVSPVGAPAAVAEGRPSRPRFLGFKPFESPWRPDEGLVRRPLAAPLGFRPSRVYRRKPGSEFRPNSSHALLRGQRSLALPAGAPEYRSAYDSVGPFAAP
jgi:hypothetical protein